MFDETKVTSLNIPNWEAVFRAEICPGVISIIAVHDNTRGVALGGCRMSHYDNEAEALTDVLRLSRGMTFKNAIADLPLGGGKSVIICDPTVKGEEREKILEEFGKFVAWVNREKDCYCTAEDMNTTVADMTSVKKYASNIFGISVDPSPYTAWGVFCAIEYAVDYFAMDHFDGNRTLKGKRVLIQGLGKVGKKLLEYLTNAGAQVLVSDINEAALKAAQETYPGTIIVPADKIMDEQVDVFAPCARGEVVTRKNIGNVNFKILCGAANNQLQNTRIGHELQRKGVIYCPDYITNMGGVCSIQYMEIDHISDEAALVKIQATVRKMLGLTFQAAFKNNISFNEAVDHVVKKIVWGKSEPNLDFNNEELFPLTSHSEPQAVVD